MKKGAAFWKIEFPDETMLITQLKALIAHSGLESAKLRIQFGVNVSTSTLDYIATMEEVEEGFKLNSTGWEIDVYKEQFKSDTSGNDHKSNNRDIYLLAKQWQLKHDLDDVLVINQTGHVVDSTRCNLFWLEGESWYTNPLHCGCVPGVMRQFILERQLDWGIQIIEKDVFPQRLLHADEIFLTNAIRGIRWIEYICNHQMKNERTKELARLLQQDLLK